MGSLISYLVQNVHTNSRNKHTNVRDKTERLLCCFIPFKELCLWEAVTRTHTHTNTPSEDVAFLCPFSRVSLTVLLSPALPFYPPVKFSPPQPVVGNSLCIIAHIPTSFTGSTLLFSLPIPHLSRSACLSVFRGRPSISQGSILSLFPNRISLPCCQTGFSEVPITASCFNNLSLGSYCYAHTRPSGP